MVSISDDLTARALQNMISRIKIRPPRKKTGPEFYSKTLLNNIINTILDEF